MVHVRIAIRPLIQPRELLSRDGQHQCSTEVISMREALDRLEHGHTQELAELQGRDVQSYTCVPADPSLLESNLVNRD